ncbi:methionine synthase [Sesbania bispinosa]|nr:methionine synthase [Sesbania bispinosa]
MTREEAKIDWMRYLGRIALYRAQLHANLGLPAVDENHAAPDDQPIEMSLVNGVPVFQEGVNLNNGCGLDS